MARKSVFDRVAPSFVRASYARRLGVVVLLVLVAVAGVGGWVFFQTDAAVTDQTRERMTFSAESQARELKQVTTLLREETRLLSQAIGDLDCETVDCGSSGESELQSFMQDELREGRLPDHVVGLHYVATNQSNGPDDPGGPLVLESTVSGFPGNEPDRLGVPWARGQNRSRLMRTVRDPDAAYVSQPWTFQPEGERLEVFAVVSRVPGEQKLFVIMVSAERLSKTLPRPGEDGFTTVVDRGSNTRVLTHRTELLLGPFDRQTSSLLDRANESAGYTTFDGTNGTLAVGYAPVEGTDWVVLTHVPTKRAFSVQALVSRNLLVLIAVAAVGLGAVVLTVGRQTARELTTLAEKADKLEDGDLETELTTDRGDEFGRLYESFDAMRDSLRDRIDQLESTRDELERERERTERAVERMAADYRDVMQVCAEGNLTRRMHTDSDVETMETVAEEFNEMMNQIEAATAQVDLFATEVAAVGEEATASVEEISTASERISETIQEIAQGAENQNSLFQGVSEEMSDLSAATEEIASASDEAADLADRNAELGREGRMQAGEAIQRMESVAVDAEETVEEFERLETRMAEIDELTATITDIADQTNRLALNANIEASRAGGDGDDEGFVAVAEEIRDLAAETKEAAEETEQLIADLRRQTNDTADIVRKTSRQVQENVETVGDTIETLDQIASGAVELNDRIQEIDEAHDRQTESTQDVIELVEQAAMISDRTAEESQTVTAAAEEQTSALTEVTETVEELAAAADRLRTFIGRYNTRTVDEIPVPQTAIVVGGHTGTDSGSSHQGDPGDADAPTRRSDVENGDRPASDSPTDDPDADDGPRSAGDRPGDDPGPAEKADAGATNDVTHAETPGSRSTPDGDAARETVVDRPPEVVAERSVQDIIEQLPDEVTERSVEDITDQADEQSSPLLEQMGEQSDDAGPSADDLTELTTEEVVEQLPDEVTEQSVDEITGDSSEGTAPVREVAAQLPDEITEQSVDEFTAGSNEEATDGPSGESTGSLSAEVSETLSEGSSEELTPGVADDLSEEVTETLDDEATDESGEGTPEQPIQEVPGEAGDRQEEPREESSEESPEQPTEEGPEESSEESPEQPTEEGPEESSERRGETDEQTTDRSTEEVPEAAGERPEEPPEGTDEAAGERPEEPREDPSEEVAGDADEDDGGESSDDASDGIDTWETPPDPDETPAEIEAQGGDESGDGDTAGEDADGNR